MNFWTNNKINNSLKEYKIVLKQVKADIWLQEYEKFYHNMWSLLIKLQ